MARLDKQLSRVDNADAQAEWVVAAIRDLVLPIDPSVADEGMEQLYFLLLRGGVVAPDGTLNIQWPFDPNESVDNVRQAVAD